MISLVGWSMFSTTGFALSYTARWRYRMFAQNSFSVFSVLNGFVFPHEGEYRLQLFTEGTLLGECRIICNEVHLEDKQNGQ